MGLTFVPTPLGNLRDITLRALDVLRAADLIVAEDSRVARRLLTAHEISGKTVWTYHEHNAANATEAIIERARTERVAVVSDAGMPAISDPGRDLLVAARAAGVPIDVLPGPTAFACAVVLSGFDTRRFTFEGFPARTSGARRSAFLAAIAAGAASVWYESPHRILDTLADVEAVAPDVRVFVLREFTKLFEAQHTGSAGEVARALGSDIRGEICLVLDGGAPPSIEPLAPDDLDRRIDELVATGASTAAIAKELARSGAGERSAIYARVGERRGKGSRP